MHARAIHAPVIRLLSGIMGLLLLTGCGGVPLKQSDTAPGGVQAPTGGLVDPGAKPTLQVKPQPGYLAPNVAAKDVNTGESITLQSFKGQVVILNFWATWCPPCKTEMPDMEAFHKETNGKVRIIGLGADSYESPEKMAAFAKSLGVTFTIAHDGATAVETYQVSGIPTSFIIDQKGVIRMRHQGPLNLKLMRELTAEAERLGK